MNWFLLLAFLLFLPAAIRAEGEENPLRIRASVFAGSYTPELEQKYNNDRLYGSFIAGGFGANTSWQHKDAQGLPLEIEYLYKDFHFEFEVMSLRSNPDYSGLTSVSLTLGSTRYDVQQFDTTAVHLTRTIPTLLVRYDLAGDRKASHELSILGGVRQMSIRGEYDYNYYQRFTITGAASASGYSVGKSFEYNSLGRGAGVVFGADYRYHFENGSELKARLDLYSMDGIWRQNRTTADVSTAATGNALIRNEAGEYHVGGVEFIAGYFHALTNNVRIFAQIRTQQSSIRDNKVALTRLEPISSTSISNYILDTALTYPGSHANERVGGLQIGAELQL